MQIVRVFDRGSRSRFCDLVPWFSLSQGFLWFSTNLSPQPSWKKNLCRLRHCHILFLINSLPSIKNASFTFWTKIKMPSAQKIKLTKITILGLAFLLTSASRIFSSTGLLFPASILERSSTLFLFREDGLDLPSFNSIFRIC